MALYRESCREDVWPTEAEAHVTPKCEVAAREGYGVLPHESSLASTQFRIDYEYSEEPVVVSGKLVTRCVIHSLYN